VKNNRPTADVGQAATLETRWDTLTVALTETAPALLAAPPFGGTASAETVTGAPAAGGDAGGAAFAE
jgi:hypothetical protein